MDLDLDLDNYKLSELLNIYQLSSLPDNEYIIDDIFTNRINNSNISNELKNFLLNIKIRLKMEIRYKKQHQKKQNQVKKINKEKTSTTYLSLDTRFRNNFYNTNSNDCIIELPYEFNNVIKLSLKSIEIINSLTTITEKQRNNNFDISYTNTNIKKKIKIIIDDGNYSTDDFKNEIQNKLNVGFQNSDFKFDFNKKTGKSKINCLTNGKFDIDFGENILEPFNTLGYKMGFRKKIYKNISNIKGESLFDMTGDRYFFLYVNDFNCNYYRDSIISIQKNDFFSKNLLGRIVLGGDTYQVIYEDSSDEISKQRIYTGPINIKKFHIKLLNIYGNLADINNIDYSIIFEITQKIS